MPLVREIPLVNNYDDDDEMKETGSSFPGYSNEMPSSAQALVQAAAYRIDLSPSKLKILLRTMKEELVTEMWQLNYMDVPSWREMGFPVGLIASIRTALEEEELLEGEEIQDSKGSHRRRAIANDNSSGDLVVPKATSLRQRMTTSGDSEEPDDDGGFKRRVSDITLSERLKLRPFPQSPPGSRFKFGSQSPNHLLVPTSERPQPLREYLEEQKEKRCSSITMPLCPSRCPTMTDLESSVQYTVEPSDGDDSYASDSLGRSLTTSSSSDEASFGLESLLTNSRVSDIEGNVENEKSMATIVTGNLGSSSDQGELH